MASYTENIEQIEPTVVPGDPGGSDLIRYALGQKADHPVIWQGQDDARSVVMAAWIRSLSSRVEQAKPAAPTQDAWLTEYVQNIAPQFDSACRLCHRPAANNVWIHKKLDGNPNTLEENLAELASQIDLQVAENSRILRYPRGLEDNNHGNGDSAIYASDADEAYLRLKAWIESLRDLQRSSRWSNAIG